MKSIIGYFRDRQDAERAVSALTNAGYSRDEISMVARDYRDADVPDIGPIQDVGHTKAGEYAAGGGLAGAVLGLLALAIPGIGPVVAAGPIAGLIAGAGIGAAAGGLIGYIQDMGVSEEEAKYYAEGIRRGGAMVAVRVADDRTGEVSRILDQNGAIDVKKQAEEWRAGGWKGYDPDAEPLPYTRRV